MNQVVRVRIGDVIDRAGGKPRSDEGLPVYSVTKHEGFVPSAEYFKKQVFSRNTSGYTVVRQGQFAYATIHLDEGSIGYAPEDCVVSPMYTAFAIDERLVDRRYFYRLVKSPDMIARYGTLGNGTVHRRRSISLERFADLSIALPPLDEQRRIAAILDKADALRQKRKRSIALLDSLVEAVVNDAFCDEPVTMTLGDVFAFQGGLQLSASRQRLPVEAPYLRVANVHRDRLELAEIKTMGMTQAEFERTALRPGDVLFVEGHGNADEIGRCAVWDGSIPNCSHQNHLIRARPKSHQVDPVVMSRWLNSLTGREHLLRRGKTTSGLNTISVSDVSETPIPSLSAKASFRLRARLDAFQGHKSVMQSQLSQMDAVFTSLQLRAFAGEL